MAVAADLPWLQQGEYTPKLTHLTVDGQVDC